MILLPFDRCTLVSSLSASEIGSRLQENVSDQEVWLFSRPKESFLGKVRDANFKITRNINYRNSFRPVLSGSIEPSGTSTLIHIRLRLPVFVLGFMCVWMGGVSLAMISLFVGANNSAPSMTKFVPVIMLLVGYGMTMGGFLYERKRSLEELQRVLSATRLTPDGSKVVG